MYNFLESKFGNKHSQNIFLEKKWFDCENQINFQLFFC